MNYLFYYVIFFAIILGIGFYCLSQKISSYKKKIDLLKSFRKDLSKFKYKNTKSLYESLISTAAYLNNRYKCTSLVMVQYISRLKGYSYNNYSILNLLHEYRHNSNDKNLKNELNNLIDAFDTQILSEQYSLEYDFNILKKKIYNPINWSKFGFIFIMNKIEKEINIKIIKIDFIANLLSIISSILTLIQIKNSI